jgi:hypothetical protein
MAARLLHVPELAQPGDPGARLGSAHAHTRQVCVEPLKCIVQVAERSHPGVGERCGTRLLGRAAVRLF